MIIQLIDPKHHWREIFSCGVPELDQYLKLMAVQQGRRDNSRTYVLCQMEDDSRIIGYYTLTMIALDFTGLSEKYIKQHLNARGAALIARLAVDQHFQGRDYGEYLLVDALSRLLTASEIIGFPLVFVDAKQGISSFYEKYGFKPLQHHPDKLFITIADIRKSMSC